MMDKLTIYERFKFARKPVSLDKIPSDRFPLIVRIIRCNVEGSGFKSGEILRVNNENFERRVIAVDSMKRTWSFPVHTGAKFDIVGKNRETRNSIYIREIVEASGAKRPKKIRFSQIDGTQVRISGQDPTHPPNDLIGGDFKIKNVARVRYFTTNRMADDEIDPKVLVLPSSFNITVTIAAGLIGMPASAMTSYMDNLTQDIKARVNFDMCRGSSDILVHGQAHSFPQIVRISNAFQSKKMGQEQKRRTKHIESGDDECEVKGSDMASLMAASRAECFRKNEEKNQNALQWLKTADFTNTTALTTLVAGEESLSEEEQLAMRRHRMRLLASLDDYGYGNEHKNSTCTEVGNGNEIEDGDRADENKLGRKSCAILRMENTREGKGVDKSKQCIEIPIILEETEGGCGDGLESGEPIRERTERRHGALCSLPGGNARNRTTDDAAVPELGQSSLVPFEFSKSQYISVTKKWMSKAKEGESQAITKTRSGKKLFTLTRSSQHVESTSSERRFSTPLNLSDVN